LGYLGITCSYIDNSFQLQENILSIRYFPYLHTGKIISKTLNSIINEWNLDNKVFTIITDNVIGKGLLEVENLVIQAKRLMLYFTTPKQTQRLLETQKKFNCNEDIVNEDYQIRKEDAKLKKINLTDIEWEAIKNLVTILEPFAEATEFLGGSKYTTISFMYSAINTIMNNLILTDDIELRQVDYKDNEDVFNDTILNEDQANNIKSVNFQQFNVPQNCVNFKERVKTALYNTMNYYWQMPSEERMLAALLDPRCKILNFTSESLKARTYDSLRELLQFTSKLLASIYRSSNIQIDEISDYIGMPEISYDQCPFEWWKSNQNQFPVLAYLACKYLAILATSTPSERLFSDAGN
ncbi:13636_t:CDS:2, partial [Racocetra persica]